MTIRLAGRPQFESIVDGPGLRTVIFLQGCPHHCHGCHNPQTWSFDGGVETEIDALVSLVTENAIGVGVTFSGGEPLEQPEACLRLLQALRKAGFVNFWAYTGYLWEDLLNDKKKTQFVAQLDGLVDGKYESQYKSLNYKFRGSLNQRIIDVRESLKADSICMFDS